MASKKTKFRKNGKKKITVPMAIVAGMAPGVWRVWAKRGSFSSITNEAGRVYLGYDSWTGQFSFDQTKFGLLPAAAGFLVHYLANKLGINRAIARTGVPFLRL